MIKQLRKKFIMSAIISVAVVLALLMIVVNVINYANMYEELDEVTYMIAENGGNIPNFRWDSNVPSIFPNIESFISEERPGEPPQPGDMQPPELYQGGSGNNDVESVTGNEQTTELNQSGDGSNAIESTNGNEQTTERRFDEGKPPRHINEETYYSLRFFSVTFDNEGNLITYNLDSIASVDRSNVGEYVDFALSKGVGKGNMDDYRYYVAEKSEGVYIAVFLNAASQFRRARLYVLYSVIAFFFSLLLATVLILFFSKKAIKPTVTAMEQQKQFITNASHELKTPLTVMSTNLKLLEMDMGKQKWIDKTEEQVQTLTELINGMVMLSRLDEERPALLFSNFNISDMLAQIAEEFEDVADDTGHTVRMDVEPELMYHGDQTSIRRMISILFDNAFKYAAPGSDIAVSLHMEKKNVVLKFSNGCNDINETDIAHLFDRFYRADQSRSKETKGFGIGLSIVRSVAENHKGYAEVKLTDPEHIEFCICLKQVHTKQV